MDRFPGIGPDFQQAQQRWLFEVHGNQPLAIAVLFLLVLFALNTGLQMLFGTLGFAALYGGSGAAGVNEVAKASIIGLLPSAVVSIAAALFLCRFRRQGSGSNIPLHLPTLGPGGWFLLLAGFALVMYVVYASVMISLGIDPQLYSPSSGGVSDEGNSAGMVEKAVADLADEPLLFAIALPGVVFAVPMAEEVIFRGAIFTALVASPVGRVGAVVITSALWSLVHGVSAPWLFVGLIFIMGLVLGVLLLRFGSLWVTIMCHALWNTLSSLVIFGSADIT